MGLPGWRSSLAPPAHPNARPGGLRDHRFGLGQLCRGPGGGYGAGAPAQARTWGGLEDLGVVAAGRFFFFLQTVLYEVFILLCIL